MRHPLRHHAAHRRPARGLGPGTDRRPGSGGRVLVIAINCFRERLRRRKREPTPVGADPAELFSGGGGETRRDSTGERIDLERTIARLPDGYREVFVLHDLQGYTHQEIAGLLEIHAGTSKSQLSRARRALRTLLTPGPAGSQEEDRDES